MTQPDQLSVEDLALLQRAINGGQPFIAISGGSLGDPQKPAAPLSGPRGWAVSERCQWMHDKEIGPWHLPGCWGAVIGGPDCCYCEGPDEDETPTIEQRLSRLEASVALLTKDAPND